jgi:hypothetical protein
VTVDPHFLERKQGKICMKLGKYREREKRREKEKGKEYIYIYI